MPDVATSADHVRKEETTILQSDDLAIGIRIGTDDKRVGDVYQEFTGGIWDTTAETDLQFTLESNTNPSKNSIRRNAVYTRQRGNTYKPRVSLREASVASNIPPGQAIIYAQVMSQLPIYKVKGGPAPQRARWITVSIDSLPRVSLHDDPYIETAPKGETIHHIGGWTPTGFQLFQRRSLQQLMDPLTVITTEEGGPTSGNGDPTESQMANFQLCLNTFNSVQANITNLIIPALAPLVQPTNNSMVLEMAWSIYSQLTGSSVLVVGPYLNGMHCFDALEARYFKDHNISSNATSFDTQTQQYFA